MRVWIDTDIGSDVDDALTLAYVLRHPDLELCGVSTVFGDVELRARIARELIERAGAPPVPVLAGRAVPLTPGRHGILFGHEGIGLFDDPAPRLRVETDPEADDRIDTLAAALERARPDVVLAIGPLSNLGALVARGTRLPRLAIMGGKVADVMLPGMVPHVPEWNWFCDARAVQQVLAAPHDAVPRVVPAEVTFRTALHDGDVDRLDAGDALARTLAVLCHEWLRAQRDRLGSKHPHVALHDPLTAATLVRPELCPFEPRRLEVDERGATTTPAGPANAEVAVDVDPLALRDHLMETWLA